ncbi:MAG: DUF1491 family protein [Rhodospirillaceae bacterium]|jgi:hypothetical protein|nr:DUF1491 family protein [Rhodospirillaceae bacterium]
MQPRVTAELWIKAHIRKCNALAIPAMVARRGDSTAGAILVKVNHLGPGCMVLTPANSLDGGRQWRRATGDSLVPEADADAYIARQLNMDPDLWVLEIEDREGRHLIDDMLE